MTTIAAVLLAGGESRRLGRDKALLRIGHVPLWKKQLDLLRRLQPQDLFVSARLDPAWRPADASLVEDRRPSRGPLSGIAATLQRTSATHLVVLAVDMPEMELPYLESLCRSITPSCGTLPMRGAHAEPLAAIYPRTAHEEVDAALNGDNFSLQSLTALLVQKGKLRPIEVSPEQEARFCNINERRDLERFSIR